MNFMPTVPVLTFPPDEGEYIVETYKKHNIILEYGSGGSTVEAARQQHPFIMSVESDLDWAKNLHEVLKRDYPAARVLLQWVDIGPTKEWGFPMDERAWRNWSNYSLAIWRNDLFQQPDLVLIDGRFRVGCFLATLFLTQKPVVVLWDDYTNRPHYHCVEKYLKPVKLVGRLARFEVEPRQINPLDLAEIITLLNIPD